jgi:DNA-binding NarL/FixJ family response regulator
VRVSLAAACRALRDDDGCRLERDAARSVFASLGARPDLARLDALDADGPEAGAAKAPSTFGLTDRELQVLRLVASGRTNKAIAVELFLAEKTVDRQSATSSTSSTCPPARRRPRSPMKTG